jgi:hypothetical protein
VGLDLVGGGARAGEEGEREKGEWAEAGHGGRGRS